MRKCLIFVIVCALLINIIPVISKASTKSLNVNAVVKESTHIKIGWKKKDVDKYNVYRANAEKDGSVGSYKKIASISGKKVFYVDKLDNGKISTIEEDTLEGNYYSYKVCGYKKINGIYRKIYEGKRMIYSGMWDTMWDEYQHCDAKVTPKSIPLIMFAEEGFTPEAYVIYRSEDGKNYKKIKEIKTKKMSATYVDKNVQTGKVYYYKARNYRLAGTEKIYSNYTDVVRLSAVNRDGSYKMKIITKENETISELLIALTSQSGNADLVFHNDSWNELSYSYNKKDEDTKEDVYFDTYLMWTEYSFDNQIWENVRDERIVLKENETIYLRFKTLDNSEFLYLGTQAEKSWLRYENAEYNHLISCIDFELENQKAVARINGEYYH